MSEPTTGELLGFHTYRSTHGVFHVQAILVDGPASVFKRPLCPTRAGRAVVGGIDPDTYRTDDLEDVAEEINAVWMLSRLNKGACEYCLIRAGTALQHGQLQLGWVHHTL